MSNHNFVITKNKTKLLYPSNPKDHIFLVHTVIEVT